MTFSLLLPRARTYVLPYSGSPNKGNNSVLLPTADFEALSEIRSDGGFPPFRASVLPVISGHKIVIPSEYNMLVHSTYHDIIYFTICGVNTLCMNSMETLKISMIIRDQSRDAFHQHGGSRSRRRRWLSKVCVERVREQA